MSIVETIRVKIKEAVVSRNEFERDILKVALGEIQTAQSRKPSNKNQYKKDAADNFVMHIIPEEMPDEEAIKVIRKMVENIDYTKEIYMRSPAVSDNDFSAKMANLNKEKEILKQFIPRQATKEEIKTFIREGTPEVIKNILLAKSDGQATGLLIKTLKEYKMNVDGKTASEIVKELRETVERKDSENG